ncbi:MAG: hypothetical protein FGM33_03490 [Candidatus Kapabacteria bacterium]|nr:hypothetical protein [Candidatus Kapabacteria bacterium]
MRPRPETPLYGVLASALLKAWITASVLLISSAGVLNAQDRPWSYRSQLLPGPAPKVRLATGALVVFDKVALRSIDHGVTLDTLRNLEGELCDFFDFSAGISFAITYEAGARKALVYFSQGGTNWEKVDSILDVARPTCGVASGFDWYMTSENGSVIHRIGETLTTLKGPSSEPIREMVITSTSMVANVAGRQLSYTTDKGATWKSIPAEGLGQLHVRNDEVFAASARGVVRLDQAKGTLEQVGNWNLPGGSIPATLDVDSHIGQLFAITADSGYRMFRLDPDDNEWVRWGYPLPATRAAASPSIMAIETGWAVMALNITEGKKDTSGIYAFDLNNFTAVEEDPRAGDLDRGLALTGAVANVNLGSDVQSAELFDASGKCLTGSLPISEGNVRLDLHEMPAGVYMLVGKRRDASLVQRLILR